MKKTLFALTLALGALPAVAVEDVIIGGVGYEHIADGVCQAYATPGLTATSVTVRREVTFVLDDGSTETCGVHRIRQDGFRGLPNLEKFSVEEYQGDGYTRLVVFGGAFADCPVLSTVELPSDLTTVVVSAFNGSPFLKSIVCRATGVPTAFYTTAGVADFDDHSAVNLYVPDGSVEAYADPEKSGDAFQFWSSFSVKPISEYAGGGDPTPEPIDNCGIELRLPLGTVTYVDATAGDRIRLEADPDSRLVSVSFGDIDMTDRVEDGIFHVPAFTGRVVLRPVFELTGNMSSPSTVGPRVHISFTGSGIAVEGLDDGDEIVIVSTDGRVVYRGLSRTVALPSGAYILSTPAGTYKFAI